MIIADPGKSYFNALSGLTQMAQQQGQIKRQNALQDFYSIHGEALAQGDQGAINALAAIDGQAAYQMRRQSAADARVVQSHEMGMQTSQANLKAITARAEHEAARWAADKGEAEVARELANHNRVLSALSTVDSPEAWDALAQQMGEEELVGQFGQREALFAQQMGLKNALERQKGPTPLSPEGKRATDVANGILPSGPVAPDFETEQKLRKEFTGLPVSKDFAAINDSFDRVQAAAKDPSAAGDLALVFNYMKLLDPGSVVRESEFATAANATGVDDRVRNLYNRLLSGERLNPEQRADFVSRAGQMFNAQAGNYNDKVEQYRGLAEQYRVSPDRIAQAVEIYEVPPEVAAEALSQVEAEQSQPPEAPEVGAEVSGYRFLGGDPADQSSWERVKRGDRR